MGYAKAGFEVVGVDRSPQPNYPFDFIEDDALDFLQKQERLKFDMIHASPPCQRYMTGGTHRKDHPDLIGQVRYWLMRTKQPWVIENVPGAPLRKDLLLCGSMFGLPLRRHRIFEFWQAEIGAKMPCHHNGKIVGVYGNPHGKRGAWPTMEPGSRETWSKAMEIDWMTSRELSQAIPPAYTEWIGRWFLDAWK